MRCFNLRHTYESGFTKWPVYLYINDIRAIHFHCGTYQAFKALCKALPRRWEDESRSYSRAELLFAIKDLIQYESNLKMSIDKHALSYLKLANDELIYFYNPPENISELLIKLYLA